MLAVDRIITQRLSSGVPLVGQVSQHIILAGGKRLRPVLLLLMAGALGYKGSDDRQRLVWQPGQRIGWRLFIFPRVSDDGRVQEHAHSGYRV